MAKATNEQVQQYVNERVRVWSERLRAVYLEAKDHKTVIDDVYTNLTDNPDWIDNRMDSPPHLLVPNDVLAWNAFLTEFINFVEGDANYAKVLQSCVRGISVFG